MTTLILQTAALLLCSYFLGAWVACLIRRTFFAHADVDDMVPVQATAQRSTAADSGVRVVPPARRPDPKPIAIEKIERNVPHAAADAATRFEAALTTAPKTAAPAATAAPVAPAPAPAAKPTAQPKPAAPPVNRVAPAAPAAPAQPPAAGPVANSAATVNAAAIAQAAAAAAAAVTVQAAKPAPTSTPTAAPAAPTPAPGASIAPVAAPAAQAQSRVVLPSASSGAGPSAVAAQIAPAAPVVPAAEDLTRIRAIDSEVQQRLLKLGVSRYRDIANWLPADVERVSRELGFTGRIEQENWIEQAQILARGGDTAYARRKDRGLIATAVPSANEGQPRPLAAAPVAAPTTAPAVSPTAPATVPGVAARAAFAAPAAVAPASVTAPAKSEPAAVATTTVAPKPAPAAAPVATATATAAVAPTAGATSPAASAADPASGHAAASAAAAAAGMGAASGMGRDNLQRISGINAEVERLLNVQGYSRYGQIAGWSPADATRIDRLLGHEGRVARESWIEQAAILARGGDTAFARQFDQRVAAKPAGAAEAPRQSRVADAIRDTASAAGAGAPVAVAAAAAAAAAGAARGADLSGLRSVRSEAYAPPHGAKVGGQDDLKRIRGVGVLIEKKLNSMGVTSYAQVANWSASDIDRVSQVLDFKGRIERENWVEQARILSAGGQTEFSRRVDRGEVETSRSS